jgi:sugar phosphate permease
MSLRGYGIIIAAFFTVSIAYSVRYGFGMLLPGMLDSLKISKTKAGIISAAYFCAYTDFSPVLGVLSDRCQARLLLTLFPALLVVGASLIAYVTTVLIGTGFGAFWPLYAAAAVDFFPKTIAGSVIGLWKVFLGIGSILSPIICGWTIDRYETFSGPSNLGCATAILSISFLIPLDV